MTQNLPTARPKTLQSGTRFSRPGKPSLCKVREFDFGTAIARAVWGGEDDGFAEGSNRQLGPAADRGTVWQRVRQARPHVQSHDVIGQ